MEEETNNIHALVNIGQTKILSNIYSDLAQPGVQKLGKAIGTVLDLGNTILLPIKLLNTKTKLIFEKNIKDYEKKLESIPEDKICVVPNEIGVPIIDRLTYVEEENLRSAFINLLTKASSIDTINFAHPGFVNLIERMAPDEAKIIQSLNNEVIIPFISLKLDTGNGTYLRISEHMTGIEKNIQLDFPENINLYLDNLISLGIIKSKGEEFRQHFDYSVLEKQYDEFINSQNERFKLLNEKLKENEEELKSKFEKLPKLAEKVTVEKGVFNITDFGMLFIKACNE